MGFKVNQLVEHDRYGYLNSFYVRIEMYRFDVVTGKLCITSAAYTNPLGAEKTHSKYKGEVSSHGSFLISQIKYNDDIIDLNDYNYFEFLLTKNVTVVEDVMEEQEVTTNELYFDFDETGDVVEKNVERIVTKNVKVGECNVEKVEIDILPVYSDFFGHAYKLLKEQYAKTFGSANIEDL